MGINNMDKNKKLILIISLVCIIILLTVGVTVAFFGWQADEALVSVTVSSGTGTCEGISDNNVLLAPTGNRNNGRIIKLKANQMMGSKAYITWNLVVNNIVNLQEESFKYELINSTTGVSYGSGNFKDITSNKGTNTITFSNSEEKLDYNTDYEFTLYLWIDGSFDNPLEMANQEFDFDISCTITGAEAGGSGVTSAEISVGDYISYTPVTTSFTTDKTKTGYSSTQTINPSELNLWRVLSINDDGTVDIISEYVTSKDVYFKGKIGYLNLVGYLNELASKYETGGITVGSRHFGYSNQTEYITDTSKFTSTAPWTCSTGGTCNPVESQGGGDTLYQTDFDLVTTVLGTRVATNPAGTAKAYWMASRYYRYISSTRWHFYGRHLDTSGVNSVNNIYYYNSGFKENNFPFALRPIVTLDSELLYEAGTEDGYWSIKA